MWIDRLLSIFVSPVDESVYFYPHHEGSWAVSYACYRMLRENPPSTICISVVNWMLNAFMMRHKFYNILSRLLSTFMIEMTNLNEKFRHVGLTNFKKMRIKKTANKFLNIYFQLFLLLLLLLLFYILFINIF